jgi:hypothetical protein
MIVRTAEDVVNALRQHNSAARREIGTAFRARALRDHTYRQRAELAEAVFLQAIARRSSPSSAAITEVMAEQA